MRRHDHDAENELSYMRAHREGSHPQDKEQSFKKPAYGYLDFQLQPPDLWEEFCVVEAYGTLL